jgi:hypothetical protein
MISEDKVGPDGNDVLAIANGSLGDAIVTWLDACAIKELEPRCVCTTGTVTLKAGDRTWEIACTPESMKAALVPFKSDARFQRSGVKRNGYTSCMYLLNHPKDVPYVANGHTRTTGSAQNASNTNTTHLGSVAKAQAFLTKWENALATAQDSVDKAKIALADAKAAAAVKELEDAKAKEAKEQQEIADAKANRAALIAKSEKLAKQLADMQALIEKTA